MHLVLARHFKFFICIDSLNLYHNTGEGTIHVSILLMQLLRYREDR